MSNNPLLSLSSLPHYAPEFDKVAPELFPEAIEFGIAEARKNIEAVKSKEPSFENTIIGLEVSSELLDANSSLFFNLLSSIGGDDYHDQVEKISPVLSSFNSDVMLDPVLFEKVKAVYDQRDDLDLDEAQKTILEDTYIGFVRGGALLSDEDKDKLRTINEKLSTLSPEFMQNVSKSAEAFEMLLTKDDEISGLPESALAGAKQAAEDAGHEGGWLFTLDYPSYIPFMQFADNRELREKIWRAFSNRAFGDDFDNQDTILEIVKLRHERAQLLGYDNHASYVLERRMAKGIDTVMSFYYRLKTVYKPAAEKDLEVLKDFAKKQGADVELKPWDFGYYSEKLKQSLFDFSSEDLRPYFPLEKVLDGTFEHFTKLFSLRFEQKDSYPVWNEDVKSYEVYDSNSNEFIGVFYADFFPRKGKKPGAWMTSFRDQGLFRDKTERPVIAIVCNFTKPTAERPSLLTHNEVLTLFHEMGHAVHGLVSDVAYRSVAGTNVKWDFVELPSHLQENWVYEKETLDLVSSHFETGEKIPSALIEKLRASKNFMAGWGGLRQLNLGILDMSWHSTEPEEISSVTDFEDRVTADTSLFDRLGGPSSTSFGHIFAGGYSAGYYSYKWAEVLDADTFEAFLESGLYDQTTAKRYKIEILTKGGSEDPNILYERFRGRPADPDAVLRREGLLANPKAA